MQYLTQHKLLAYSAHAKTTDRSLTPPTSTTQEYYRLRQKTNGVTGIMEFSLWNGKGGLGDFLHVLGSSVTPDFRNEISPQLPTRTEVRQALRRSERVDDPTIRTILEAYDHLVELADRLTSDRTRYQELTEALPNSTQSMLRGASASFNVNADLVATRMIYQQGLAQPEVIFQALHILSRTTQALAHPDSSPYLTQLLDGQLGLTVRHGQINLAPDTELNAQHVQALLDLAATGAITMDDISLDLELKIAGKTNGNTELLPTETSLNQYLLTSTENRTFYDYFTVLHYLKIMPELLPGWAGITGQAHVHPIHAFAVDTHTLQVSRMMQWQLDILDMFSDPSGHPLKKYGMVIGQIENYLIKIQQILANKTEGSQIDIDAIKHIHQLARKIENYACLFEKQESIQLIGSLISRLDEALFQQTTTSLDDVKSAINTIIEAKEQNQENGNFGYVYQVLMGIAQHRTTNLLAQRDEEIAGAAASLAHDLAKASGYDQHEIKSAREVQSSKLYHFLSPQQQDILTEIIAGHGLPFKHNYDLDSGVMTNSLSVLIKHPVALSLLAASDHLGLSFNPQQAITESNRRLMLVARYAEENMAQFRQMKKNGTDYPQSTQQLLADLGASYARSRNYDWNEVTLDSDASQRIAEQDVGLRFHDNRVTVYGHDRPGFAMDLLNTLQAHGLDINAIKCFTTPDGRILDIIDLHSSPDLTVLTQSADITTQRLTNGHSILKLTDQHLSGFDIEIHPVPIFRNASEIETDRFMDYTIISTATPVDSRQLTSLLSNLKARGYNLISVQTENFLLHENGLAQSTAITTVVLNGQNNNETSVDKLRRDLAKIFGN